MLELENNIFTAGELFLTYA